VREGLPIRNLFTVFEDWVEVELVGGKMLICNIDDLYFVELHNWYCTSGYTPVAVLQSNISIMLL